MKTVTTISEPRIAMRPEQPYVGIRIQTPFKGMFKVVGQLEKALHLWIKQHADQVSGARFLRYHVINMAGEMDIELAVPVRELIMVQGQFSTDVLPQGRYASLIYTGNGLTGHKTLLEWGAANGISWDKWGTPKGDTFAARYEMYLTDPKIEPRKKKWQIELAIKLSDQLNATDRIG